MKRVILTSLLAMLGAGAITLPASADVYQCDQVQEVAPKPAEPLRYRTEIRPEPAAQEVVVEGRNCRRLEADRSEGRSERRSMKRRHRYGTRNDPGRYSDAGRYYEYR
jgi:hypothetical protein